MVTAAGFQDAWSALHPADLGVTWPMHQEDPPYGSLTPQRIDLILSKNGGMEPVGILQTGTAAVDGLWSSDHAGVVAKFRLLP